MRSEQPAHGRHYLLSASIAEGKDFNGIKWRMAQLSKIYFALLPSSPRSLLDCLLTQALQHSICGGPNDLIPDELYSECSISNVIQPELSSVSPTHALQILRMKLEATLFRMTFGCIADANGPRIRYTDEPQRQLWAADPPMSYGIGPSR
ncbi:hypothetical protein B0H10DRAFT_1957823 [Mycena sp. CBHHK59/15]|nr:hypothetical protein B0H10DRAFT_1957823 [Mycena sp. CBHHK59/15]